MRRHPGLVPLSHDHHHALVQARRLRRAAGTPAAADAARAFARFFAEESVPHFREEEETLFPLVADDPEAQPLVVEALVQHQRLHALAARLDSADGLDAVARELGELLEAHVRLEERLLFPLIERLAGPRLGGRPVGIAGRGPVWGAESEDLNATLLAWSAGTGTPEHVNDERDVLLAVIDGSATLRLDGEERELSAGDVLIVAKGSRRAVTAGGRGVRYLTAHLRRPPLQISPSPRRAPAPRRADGESG